VKRRDTRQNKEEITVGILIKIQSFKDYKSGHIKKDEVLEGKTIMSSHKSPADAAFDRELDKSLDELFNEVQEHNIRITKVRDWIKAPHHKHCCCGKCAPTKEDLYRKVRDFNKDAAEKAEKQIWLGPSDCEPE
jgi:hypothetical protein